MVLNFLRSSKPQHANTHQNQPGHNHQQHQHHTGGVPVHNPNQHYTGGRQPPPRERKISLTKITNSALHRVKEAVHGRPIITELPHWQALEAQRNKEEKERNKEEKERKKEEKERKKKRKITKNRPKTSGQANLSETEDQSSDSPQTPFTPSRRSRWIFGRGKHRADSSSKPDTSNLPRSPRTSRHSSIPEVQPELPHSSHSNEAPTRPPPTPPTPPTPRRSQHDHSSRLHNPSIPPTSNNQSNELPPINRLSDFPEFDTYEFEGTNPTSHNHQHTPLVQPTSSHHHNPPDESHEDSDDEFFRDAYENDPFLQALVSGSPSNSDAHPHLESPSHSAHSIHHAPKDSSMVPRPLFSGPINSARPSLRIDVSGQNIHSRRYPNALDNSSATSSSQEPLKGMTKTRQKHQPNYIMNPDSARQHHQATSMEHYIKYTKSDPFIQKHYYQHTDSPPSPPPRRQLSTQTDLPFRSGQNSFHRLSSYSTNSERFIPQLTVDIPSTLGNNKRDHHTRNGVHHQHNTLHGSSSAGTQPLAVGSTSRPIRSQVGGSQVPGRMGKHDPRIKNSHAVIKSGLAQSPRVITPNNSDLASRRTAESATFEDANTDSTASTSTQSTRRTSYRHRRSGSDARTPMSSPPSTASFRLFPKTTGPGNTPLADALAQQRSPHFARKPKQL